MIQTMIPWSHMPLHHRNLAEEVIRLYVDWLNSHDSENGSPRTPTPMMVSLEGWGGTKARWAVGRSCTSSRTFATSLTLGRMADAKRKV